MLTAASWFTIRAVGLRDRARLTKETHPAVAPHRPVNLKALDAFLQGNYYLTDVPDKPTGWPDEGLRKAGDYFQHAIDADPSFARAYVGLSNARSWLWWRTEEDFNEMKNAAEKAVELDPTSSEARMQLAEVKAKDWDWSGEEDQCRRAIKLDPNKASSHECLAEALDQREEMDEGWKEHEIAKQLEPNHDYFSVALYLRGRYDQAIDLLRRLVESRYNTNVTANHWYLSLSYAQKRMYGASVQELVMAETSYGLAGPAMRLQRTFTSSGWMATQSQWAKENEQFIAEKRIYNPGHLARAYAQIGDKDRAFYWLEQGRVHRHLETLPILRYVKVDPSFDPLRSDPRFNEFLRRAGPLR